MRGNDTFGASAGKVMTQSKTLFEEIFGPLQDAAAAPSEAPIRSATHTAGSSPALSSPPDPASLLILQRQLYEGKQDSVRASLLPLHEARADDQWPGTLSTDAAYLESLLLLALGDSARAVSQLDRALNALRLSGVGLLEMGQAATLIRAMALRAELAASQRDARSARLWAGPVTILWRNADEELQKVVQSMNVLNRS